MRSKFTLAVLSGAVAISLASFGAQANGTGDIAFGTPDTALPIAAGTNTLNYSASVKKATATVDVTPGDFTAVANFTLAYQ